MRTGIANFPLHGGKAPRWLFERMKRLAREIVIIIVKDFGSKDILKKLSDPYWFQAFGCVLGFDWHSSGVTTTVCGAIKEGIKGIENDLGIFAAGGKGGWAVVQQGMNDMNNYARRYHWFGESILDFVCEPHSAVCCNSKGIVLNMIAKESDKAREASTQISWERPETIVKKLKKLKILDMPERHSISLHDINPDRLYKIFFIHI